MKSQHRAWIVFAVLFFAWNTLPASPFSYFAEMICHWALFLTERTPLSSALQVILIDLIFAALLSVLLLIGRGRSRLYLAGVCSLATLVHHAIYCIQTGKVYAVSPAIVIGLALALLFLIIKAKSPALWLSDAYIVALSVWLIRDGVLPALFDQLHLSQSPMADFLDLPADPLIRKLDHFLQIPQIVWAILPLLLAVLPLCLFAKGRQKG